MTLCHKKARNKATSARGPNNLNKDLAIINICIEVLLRYIGHRTVKFSPLLFNAIVIFFIKLLGLNPKIICFASSYRFVHSIMLRS